jgi:hypothetical protein
MKYGACSMEQARELLNHPRMREHVASESCHLAQLKLDIEDRQPKGPQPPPAYLLAKNNREELYEKVWSLPTREVARYYGFSDVRLGKLCKILHVPKPGRGYWAQQAAGKPTPKRPPLPLLENRKAGWSKSMMDRQCCPTKGQLWLSYRGHLRRFSVKSSGFNSSSARLSSSRANEDGCSRYNNVRTLS